MDQFKLGAGVAALALVSASLGHAEPAPGFDVLLRQARADAPRLAESEADVRAARGRAEQAGVRPNPVLGLEVENIAGSRPYSGLSQAQTTLSASQTLELGGKRGARVAAGDAEVRAAQAQGRLTGADFAYDLAAAYVAAEAAQARADLISQDLDRAREDLRAARALVEAGKEADLRAVQARAAASAVQADLQNARADAAAALARLSALVGHTPGYTATGPSLLAQAGGLPLVAATQPTTSPAVARAQAERDAAAKRVAVERARGTPDLTVSVGARRFATEDATALVGSVSAPLPLFNRNRGSITAARAELDAAEARLRTAQLDTEADWRAGSGRASAAEARLQAAAEGESAAADAYRLARLGYEAGKAPLSEVLASRRSLMEAQLRTLDARSQRVLAQAALARLSGVAFGE